MNDEVTALRGFLRLSESAKRNVIELCLVYPETENLEREIERAKTIGSIVPFLDLKHDFDKIVAEMNSNPMFGQLQSTKNICIEVLKSLVRDLDPMLERVDYILFQRMKMPILCLRNDGTKNVSVGVSALIELTEFRTRVHRMVDLQRRSSWTALLGVVAIAIAVASYLKK